MSIPQKIRIREVGPREGFQVLADIVPLTDKLELISALTSSGIKEIEVASFVNPKKVPQMADAEELVSALKKEPGVKYYGLYLNIAGFERAEAALKLDNQGWLSVACSDLFMQKNSNSNLSQFVTEIPAWLKAFEKSDKAFHGIMLSTAFGCSYQGDISTERVKEVVGIIQNALQLNGISRIPEICLADTMGWGTPDKVRNAIRALKKLSPETYLSLHLHDTRGCGILNAYIGLEEGIDCFDSSVGGMGGCPFAKGAAGNISTEDLVYLCSELGIDTGINLDRIAEAANLAERITGRPNAGRYARSLVS